MMNEVLPCPSCSANMTLVACSSSKSPDLLIWCCCSCRKYKNIRAESVLGDARQERNVNWLLRTDTVCRVRTLCTVCGHCLYFTESFRNLRTLSADSAGLLGSCRCYRVCNGDIGGSLGQPDYLTILTLTNSLTNVLLEFKLNSHTDDKEDNQHFIWIEWRHAKLQLCHDITIVCSKMRFGLIIKSWRGGAWLTIPSTRWCATSIAW